MKKIRILIGVIIIVILIIGSYFIFFRKGKEEYSLVKASRGNVVQEVSESGTVKMGEEINLSFKNSGRVEKIFVKVGDEVEAAKGLAQLDITQLSVQLGESQAALAVTQAQLNKLLAGASAEEIEVAETEVKNKQISLDTAKENLNQAYEDALNTLDDSYLKLYNALITVNLVQRTYFYSSDQESTLVRINKDKMESAIAEIKSYLDIAKNNSTNDSIDTAISEMRRALDTASGALGIIRGACEAPLYQSRVSSTDKTSLDTHRTNINTALTNITNSQQNISSMKLSQASAEGALNKAQNELSKLKAPPRQEDIDLYQSQVKQAQAKVNILNVQIQDSTILVPTAGQITKVNKRTGEIVQATETVISILPRSPFQIEVDIYEEDIVKVKIGNPVDIKLTAFPDRTFQGKVITIDPAEKLIEGVVYYEINIDFEEAPPEIKPGMTADITVKTDLRENVLTVPKTAIEKKDDQVIIQILKDKKIEERQIQIGLEGSNDLVEVISGIQEGEEIVIK